MRHGGRSEQLTAWAIFSETVYSGKKGSRSVWFVGTVMVEFPQFDSLYCIAEQWVILEEGFFLKSVTCGLIRKLSWICCLWRHYCCPCRIQARSSVHPRRDFELYNILEQTPFCLTRKGRLVHLKTLTDSEFSWLFKYNLIIKTLHLFHKENKHWELQHNYH
jgi:hypothetical protein